MRAFLVIDTEDNRNKIEVTNKQISILTPIIKKINKNNYDFQLNESYELFKEIVNINEDEITSINIVYSK